MFRSASPDVLAERSGDGPGRAAVRPVLARGGGRRGSALAATLTRSCGRTRRGDRVTSRCGRHVRVESAVHVRHGPRPPRQRLLMAVFFFVVGMEIKRELVVGELRDPRRRPARDRGAGRDDRSGGDLRLQRRRDRSIGWGMPIATDIAFALGVVALLGPACRLPSRCSCSRSRSWMTSGHRGDRHLLHRRYRPGLLPCRRHRGGGGRHAPVAVDLLPVLVVAGVGLWLAVFESGVHATIAGVIMGLLMPARPIRRTGGRAARRRARGPPDLRATRYVRRQR